MLISFGTLVVLIYQSRLMREHEERSAIPKLELWNDLSNGEYGLYIVNRGLGPAIIEGVTLEYKRELYNTDPLLFTQGYSDSLDLAPFSFSGTSLYEGVIIRNDQRSFLVKSEDSLSTALLKELFYHRDDKVKVIVHYSSIYGKVWSLEGIGDVPSLNKRFEPKVFKELFNN